MMGKKWESEEKAKAEGIDPLDFEKIVENLRHIGLIFEPYLKKV